MKKRTLALILFALTLTGILLFTLSLKNDSSSEPYVITPVSSPQSMQLSLHGCKLTVISGETTSVELIGFRENDISVYEKNGILVIADRLSDGHRITLGGIAKSIREIGKESSAKEIVLSLSAQDLGKSINIAVQDSELTLSADIQNLTVFSKTSTVTMSSDSFTRWDAYLENCQATLKFSASKNDFSRNIKTFDTVFSFNGESGANSEYHLSDSSTSELIVESQGGTLSVEVGNN